MMKWELKEKYDVQDEEFHILRAKYDQNVIEAGTRLADLKATRDAILREEIQGGVSKAEEKTRASEAISLAEAALKAAESDRDSAHDYARIASAAKRINIRDLVIDWNGPHRQKIRDAELAPIVERMAHARSEYYNCLLDFMELREKYASQHFDISRSAYDDDRNYPGNHMMAKEVATKMDLPLILDDELHKLQSQYRIMPPNFERVKGGK